MRQLHGDRGPGAHDRWCHPLLACLPWRGSGVRCAPRRGAHRSVEPSHGRALELAALAGAQERTVTAPFGEVPVAAFARYTAFDGLVHGWDLSRATGLPYEPPDDLVAEVDAFARQFVQPEMRDGDTFAAETEPGPEATPLERIVAFSGREIHGNTNNETVQ